MWKYKNSGVISRLQRALGVIQPNEASCSSESSLSWLQMGQLGDDEKLWEGGPKLCLCILLNFLRDKRTPAIQFYIKINMRHFQGQKRCGGRQDFVRLCGKNTPSKQIHNIQSGLGSLLNEKDIPICIKYMLVFSWAINFEVNWRSSNSKDSWGHWQHVWVIMMHESTLTLVIAGFWWVGQYLGVWGKAVSSHPPSPSFFPLYRQDYKGVLFFLLASNPSLSIFSISHLPQHPVFFISPSSIVGMFLWKKTVWLRVFQQFINPCLCCLICYPFKFIVFPLSMW